MQKPNQEDDIPIDLSSIIKIIKDDKKQLKEIIDEFFKIYPEKISDLEISIQKKDALQLEKAAHSIKGILQNFGASKACQAAFTLEQRGREKNLTGISEKLSLFQKSFKDVVDCLALPKWTNTNEGI